MKPVKNLSEFEDVKKYSFYTNKKGDKISDAIYTFDIETTSLFYINGKWTSFDYSIPQKGNVKEGILGYDMIPKAGVCYHCQFSVNDQVYFFRELKDFEWILKKISNPFLKKIIYIHNSSFETEWILPILAKYTIVNMIAREARKPIAYTIEELNIEIRCSFMLTNLSLENASKKYTNVVKAVGDLDYSILRSPLTPLNEQEKYYCQMDCICLYEIIKHFRKEYKHLDLIPYTQTGEVRRAYKKVVPKLHFDYVHALVPSLEEYKILKAAFMGGITHGNCLHIFQYLKDVMSGDISSSYPYSMISEKYPCERFQKVNPKHDRYYDGEQFAKLYIVRFLGLKAKMYNHYLSYSHCRNCVNESLDNGRVVCADLLETTVTDIDLTMIQGAYSYKRMEVLELWIAKKEYLPKYFIEFILKLYGDKTQLKGVEGQEVFYQKQKQNINALFGACVMDLIQSSCVLDKGKWIQSEVTDEFMQLKLDEEKERFNLFVYSTGVWITAYSRRNLFERLMDNDYELDKDVVYYDTDSLKILNMEKHVHIFEEYNKKVVDKLWKMCIHYGIAFNKCCPKDIKGKKHMIGVYDLEDGDYTEFCTLGAKRYIYRDREDGNLHMTVSGVKKSAVSALNNDIRNFNKDTFFNYKEANKNIIAYNDDQEPLTFEDCNGVEYHCDWSTSIVIYPTTYSMSVDVNFEDFVNFMLYKKSLNAQNDFIAKYKKLNQRKR